MLNRVVAVCGDFNGRLERGRGMAGSEVTVKSFVITQAIAVLVFVLVPVGITAIVPRTMVELRHRDGGATARVTRHVLLVVPLPTSTIDGVTAVESHVREAKRDYASRSDRREGRKSNIAGDGSVWIIGGDAKAIVQSTPDDAPRQAEQIQAFLADSEAPPLVLTATAGRLTYWLGGVLTFFAALYLVGATLATIRWLLRQALPRGE
jgi:hypothetical protein